MGFSAHHPTRKVRACEENRALCTHGKNVIRSRTDFRFEVDRFVELVGCEESHREAGGSVGREYPTNKSRTSSCLKVSAFCTAPSKIEMF